ncbi:MAG: dihydrolipoamide acetyltransferase family protein [Actinomycetales bacterium]
MTQEVFRLPDVGEGLTEAEIVTWHVQVGDDVVINQVVASIETAKAIVELPSPFAGRVHTLHVDQGALVLVGSPILTVEVTEVAAAESGAVLVGYGVNNGEGSRRLRRQRADSAVLSVEPAAPNNATTSTRAKPLVRRMARELGLDLNNIVPSGRHGEVTREDLLGALQLVESAGGTSSPGLSAERIPVRGVQRAMADAMVASAFSAPQVTVWRDVEVSRFVDVLAKMRDHPNFAGVRVTPLVLVAAGLIQVIRQFPKMNARWVEEGGAVSTDTHASSAPDSAHMQLHGHVNLGIAVDTERGLLVPNLKDAEQLGLRELARGLQDLITTARDGRSSPQDLTGGTVTITNIGIFDVDGGTPILNPGESMIVATGRIADRPWVVDSSVVVRPVMTLSMSFDHRIVDGSQASRALSALATFLQDPALALLLD